MAVERAVSNISQNPSVGLKMVAKSIMYTTGWDLGVRRAAGRVAFSIETSGIMDRSGMEQ